MATTYPASVADLLALDTLLDGMNDLDRSSIERAIRYRAREGAGTGGYSPFEEDGEDVIDDAVAEYRDVVRDIGKIREQLVALSGEVPATLTEKVDAILELVDALPDSLDALDAAA